MVSISNPPRHSCNGTPHVGDTGLLSIIERTACNTTHSGGLSTSLPFYLQSHQHQKASCFHPNVAGYFRNLAKEKASILDAVIKFVYEKQVAENLCPHHLDT